MSGIRNYSKEGRIGKSKLENPAFLDLI